MVVLADSEDVQARLVGEYSGAHDVGDPLAGGRHVTGRRIRSEVGKTDQSKFHADILSGCPWQWPVARLAPGTSVLPGTW